MGILEILYPPRCPVCQGILRGRGSVCKPCANRLPYLKEPICKKCGKEIERAELEYCSDCQRFRHAFDKGAAVFAYDDVMRRSVSMFKYHNRREYAAFYAKEMYERRRYFLETCQPEVVMPVPIHKQKKRKRGFNQAELVAKEFSRISKIPLDLNCLVRSQATTPQKELTRQQRKENLKKAFRIGEMKNTYHSVLLIDDIYTTGATIDAISEVLQENHIKNVFFLTICVGRND